MDEGQPSRPRPGPRPASAPTAPLGPEIEFDGRLDALPEEHASLSISGGHRGVPCDFRGAYIFAAGHTPSESLCGPKCNGTVAENTIRAGNGPEHESKFALCTRHSDLLWLLGYHGELRDGSLLHARSAGGFDV